MTNPIDMTLYMICPKLLEPHNQILKSICIARSTVKKEFICIDCETGKETLQELYTKEKEKKEDPLIEIKTEPLTNKLNIPLIHLDSKKIMEEFNKTGFKECDVCHGTGKITWVGRGQETVKCTNCKDGWVPIIQKDAKVADWIKEFSDWKCENCKRGEDKIKRRGETTHCVTCYPIVHSNSYDPEAKKKRLNEIVERVSSGKFERNKIRKNKRIIDLAGPSSLLNSEESSETKQIILTFRTEKELELYDKLTKLSMFTLVYPHLNNQIMMILNRYLKKDVNYKGEYLE